MTQACDVDLWLISLESEREVVLSPDEELRAARFHFEHDRVRWIRAHSALRVILAACTGTPAREIRFVTGPHGKPFVEEGGEVEFSLSHSGKWAMVAMTRGVRVGVDIEQIREKVNMRALLERLSEPDLPEGITDLYDVWTCREARSKAAGGALFDVLGDEFGVCKLEAPAGYSAFLALVGHEPVVHRRSGTGAAG